MNKFIITGLFAGILLLAGCTGAKDKKGDLTDLKTRLEKLKQDKTKLEKDIAALEEQIAKADPNAAQKVARLVAVDTLRLMDFTHYIELQGKVDANDVVMVTPRGMPAQVKQLYIHRGDMVREGQLLAKLDDAILQQQLDGLKVQLAYAENLYNRQKALWDQGIGTEVQLISAKNNVDGLNKQIATLTENWKTSFVYAPISGVVDELNVKVGEIFNGGAPTMPQIKLVNGSTLKVVTEVPENYAARVHKGDSVQISIPDSRKPDFHSVINVIGASINPNTRAFITEARLPSDPILKPNQIATLRIRDYQNKKTTVVKVELVQSDENGKYVYVMEKSGDKYVARRKTVTTGESYGDQIEIRSGLSGGDVLISEGYLSLYDGQAVTTSLVK